MKKEEYMGALQSALDGFDDELVQEIISDYEERFRVGLEKGKTEESIIIELGSIKDLVEELGEMQPAEGDNFRKAEGIGTENTEQQTQEREENANTYSNSGTYYQEKSFSETFDSALKKFGKVLDGVMKEAGKVINEAAVQIERHVEEVKKDHYYTYNGAGTTYEGSERDMEGEPNVEQSGQGAENCRRVVVAADIADVVVRPTREKEPKVVCHYYSHKTAMMYPFYAKQEGDTFYVGIRRNQNSEKKSGFFQFNLAPSIQIELMLPEGLTIIEAGCTSGSLELNEIQADELVLRSKSGDINANYVTCGKLYMEAMSGSLELEKSTAKTAALNTKSGDCNVYLSEVEKLEESTASGDAAAKSVKVAITAINTASGDIVVDDLQGRTAVFHTASGDIEVNDSRGESLEAGSASGDVAVRADYKKYAVKSQSGDVTMESRHDADVTAGSTSGDVEIRIVEALETYQVTMNSVSGDCTTSGQTQSASSIPTKTIEAKSISGDIMVRFL